MVPLTQEKLVPVKALLVSVAQFVHDAGSSPALASNETTLDDTLPGVEDTRTSVVLLTGSVPAPLK
jgi:hypothetical protein